ncbi:MAG: hypothetical protein ACREDJ_08280 [Methylocella sp.]
MSAAGVAGAQQFSIPEQFRHPRRAFAAHLICPIPLTGWASGLRPNDGAGAAATPRGIAGVIVETFDPATTASAAIEEAPDSSGRNRVPWIGEAYFGKPPSDVNVSVFAAASG